jgi:predicted dehydrogenase
MARTPLRAGIIGLGYGRAHIAGCQAAGIEVTAVCQRNIEQASVIASRYGIPKVVTQWEELVRLPELDLVVIAAPPSLHHPITLRAFELGKHVLCEKPLALNVEQARAMIAAAGRTGCIGMTVFNWRFTPGMQRVRKFIDGGSLGRVFHTNAIWYGHRYADPDAPTSWRLSRALAGSGTLGDMGVHLIDLHRWLFGEFTRISAQSGVAYPDKSDGEHPRDAEDYCTVVAELSTGAQVTIQLSRVTRGKNFHSLAAFGDKGAIDYRLLREGGGPRWYRGELFVAQGKSGLERVALRGGLPRGVKSQDAFDVTGYATIAPLMREMARSIRTGSAESPSFEDGLKAQVVVQAIQEAAATHTWVEVKE